MNLLRAVSLFVQLLIFGIAIALGVFNIIPLWAAVILAILSFILNGYITLGLLRLLLGTDRFADLVAKARSEQPNRRNK
jgi:hypothetical protein